MHGMTRRLLAELLGTFMLVFFSAGALLSTVFPKAGFGLHRHFAVCRPRDGGRRERHDGHFRGPPQPRHHGRHAGRPPDRPRRPADSTSSRSWPAPRWPPWPCASWCRAAFPSVLMVGTPTIAPTITLVGALWIEAVLGFFLMSAVMGTIVSPNAPRIAGFGVGLTLVVCVLFGGPMTGASGEPRPRVRAGAGGGSVDRPGGVLDRPDPRRRRGRLPLGKAASPQGHRLTPHRP